jgi:hypothetical protein
LGVWNSPNNQDENVDDFGCFFYRGEKSADVLKKLGEWINRWINRPTKVLTQPKGTPMLWTIIVILVILWLLGFVGHIGGGLIHLLLVIAVVILIINLIQGRRGL